MHRQSMRTGGARGARTFYSEPSNSGGVGSPKMVASLRARDRRRIAAPKSISLRSGRASNDQDGGGPAARDLQRPHPVGIATSSAFSTHSSGQPLAQRRRCLAAVM